MIQNKKRITPREKNLRNIYKNGMNVKTNKKYNQPQEQKKSILKTIFAKFKSHLLPNKNRRFQTDYYHKI